MGKMLIVGLVTLALGISAAAFAWRVYAPKGPSETVPAQVADAPSSRESSPRCSTTERGRAPRAQRRMRLDSSSRFHSSWKSER
jgi:hypothetical protein